MVNSEHTFTYPPSMCFFAGGDSLVIPADVQKFIEYKKSTQMDDVASKAIRDLRIGDLSLGSEATLSDQTKEYNIIGSFHLRIRLQSPSLPGFQFHPSKMNQVLR